MGNDEPPPAPVAPDYAAANREAVMADIETLPIRLKAEREASLGLGEYAGLGDSERLRQQIDLAAQSAPAMAQLQYDTAAQYNPQYIDLARQGLQQSDPTRFALQESYNQKALDDLNLGNAISPEQQRSIEQATRAAQSARGNAFGAAASGQEIFSKYNLGEQNKLQRQQVASNALGLGGIASEFGQLSGAQNGASPFSPMGASNPFMYTNQNAGAQGTGFAQGIFGTQASIYNTQMSNQQENPWMQGLGMAAGIGTKLGGAALMGCWVAREVYGESNPKWLIFREWLLEEAPRWLCLAYLKHGERFARFIKNKPLIKQILRGMMDLVVKPRFERLEEYYGS